MHCTGCPKKKFPGQQTISGSWLRNYMKWSDDFLGAFLKLYMACIKPKFDNLHPGMHHPSIFWHQILNKKLEKGWTFYETPVSFSHFPYLIILSLISYPLTLILFPYLAPLSLISSYPSSHIPFSLFQTPLIIIIYQNPLSMILYPLSIILYSLNCIFYP